MQSALVGAGFDVLLPSADHISHSTSGEALAEKRKEHIRQCSLCQEEEIQSNYDSKSALDQLCVGPKTRCSSADISDLRVEEENVTATDQKSPIAPSIDTHDAGPFRVTLSIGGMTCSSCSGTVTMMVSGLQGVSEVAVSLLSKSATVIVDHKKLVEVVVNTVEDCGFEVDVMNVTQLDAPDEGSTSGPRTIALHIDGMFCR
jgi:P-type Cu+ transporter